MNALVVCWEGKATGANRRLGYGGGRAYPDPDYVAFMKDLTLSIRKEMGWCPPWPYPIEGPVKVDLVLRIRRMDIDSLVKPVLDCIEKAGAIKNDSQVAELHVCRKGLPPGRPNKANCWLMLRLESIGE